MLEATTTADTTTTSTDELATLKAQVAALTAANAEAGKRVGEAAEAAEAARKAGLSEAEKLLEERKAFTIEIETERGRLVTEARKAALSKLGVFDKAMSLAPAVDPREPRGAAELEAWVKFNPEFVRSAGPGEPPPMQAAPESKLARVLGGVLKNPYVTAGGLRRILGS